MYSALPLGEGIISDPFMGSGSTVAAAEAMGLRCGGVERHAEYFEAGVRVIPRLAALGVALPTPVQGCGHERGTVVRHVFSFCL